MPLFRRRPPRMEFGVSVDALWGALKAALPSVTTQATFYEAAHRVEWTMDKTAFDWAELMSARVEQDPAHGSVLTVEGKSAQGFAPHTGPSMFGPGRRRTAAKALLAAVSDHVAHLGEAAAQPFAEDAYRYWNGHEWTVDPPPTPPAPPGSNWP